MLNDSRNHRGAHRLDHAEQLLAQSSFGSPGAAAVRAGVTDRDGDHITRRSDRLEHGLDTDTLRRYAAHLEISDQAMHSARTPEFAYRLPGLADEAEWQLSWLPGRRLTRLQALLGMILDDVLSNPDLVTDPALDDLTAAATALGLDVRDAVTALTDRSAARRYRLPRRDTVTTGAHPIT